VRWRWSVSRKCRRGNEFDGRKLRSGIVRKGAGRADFWPCVLSQARRISRDFGKRDAGLSELLEPFGGLLNQAGHS